jgi:hypothetical protein
MTLRKPVAAAAAVMATFVIAATEAGAATVTTAHPAATESAGDPTCPNSYGFHNAATGSCLPWSRYPWQNGYVPPEFLNGLGLQLAFS